MPAVKLAKDVYWVGAVDWTLRDFHGYTTSRGTTYNAYLIIDERPTLIDVVKRGFFDELVFNIEEVIPLRELKYVVLNHMEPDHTGVLTQMLKEAPQAELVASQRCEPALSKYHKLDRQALKVKTGDELLLGSRKLRFIEVPMLHWPDSMMTYLVDEDILFSSDAFGQHLATATRFDDQCDLEVLMYEAAKYYANIILPYSSLVLNKLNELEKLQLNIKLLAPGHGVIWRAHITDIVESYKYWASASSTNKVVIVYDTMWGSTEQMAKAVMEGVANEGVEVQLYHLRKSEWSHIIKELMDAKALLVGTPTLNNTTFPTVAGFLNHVRGLFTRYLKRVGVEKKRFALAFGSYGWSGEAVKEVGKQLEEMGFEVLPPLSIQYLPSREEIRSLVEFGRKVAEKVKAA